MDTSKIIRRFFITFTLTLGILLTLSSCNRTADMEDNRFLLDTIVSIKIYQSKDRVLLDNAFELITTFEKELSHHHKDSEISRINGENNNKAILVSANAFSVLQTALNYSELSDGLFDPTVGPLVNLWGIGGESPRVPSDEEIESTLKVVDYRGLDLNPVNNHVRLQIPGAQLDVGGIAKGWIADKVAEYLSENGAEHILINLGGNIRLLGGKPDDTAFKIGMQNPFEDRGRYLGIFSIKSGSVVSSGIYERFFDSEGQRYHHILDPKSGKPVDNDLAAVTVISEQSVDGDALSTALFALGLERGMNLVKQLPRTEAAFVRKDGTVILTPNAHNIFESSVENLKVEIYDH